MKQLNYADPYWVEEFETRCYKTEALSFKDQSHLNASKYSPQPTVSKPQQILRAFYKRILMNTKINFPNSQKSQDKLLTANTTLYDSLSVDWIPLKYKIINYVEVLPSVN